MNVMFIGEDWCYGYACVELAVGYRRIISAITSVATSFVAVESSKILVVVRSCPCCSQTDIGRFTDETEGFVLVSPLVGIDNAGYNIAIPAVFPPFRTPGLNDESATVDAFLKAWRETIEKALLTSGVLSEALGKVPAIQTAEERQEEKLRGGCYPH